MDNWFLVKHAWYNSGMATSGKEVQKNVKALKKAMGMKGDLKPGDLQVRAHELLATSPKKVTEKFKLPAVGTKKGVAMRGLI